VSKGDVTRLALLQSALSLFVRLRAAPRTFGFYVRSVPPAAEFRLWRLSVDDNTHFEKTRLGTAPLLILPTLDAGRPLEAGGAISLRFLNVHFNYALDDVHRAQDYLRLLKACKFGDSTDSWSERSASRTQKPVPASLARRGSFVPLVLRTPRSLVGCPRSFNCVRQLLRRECSSGLLASSSAHFVRDDRGCER
jgi:hypothetical protein